MNMAASRTSLRRVRRANEFDKSVVAPAKFWCGRQRVQPGLGQLLLQSGEHALVLHLTHHRVFAAARSETAIQVFQHERGAMFSSERQQFAGDFSAQSAGT